MPATGTAVSATADEAVGIGAAPHRLAGRKPDISTDIVVAAASIGLAVICRAIVDILSPGVIVYAFVFPAAIFASLVAGARSGLLTTAGCQLLAWYFVIPVKRSFAISTPDAIGLFVATASVALTVWLPNELRGFSIGAFIAIAGLIGYGLAPSLVTMVSGLLGGEAHLATALAIVGVVTSGFSFVAFIQAMRHAPQRPIR